MTDSSKRVFISYRRDVAQHLSLLLFFKLEERDYEVFRDYSSVGPGDFERIIPDQIASRDHFILLLTPNTIERCNYDETADQPKSPNPNDWLRKEIEYAIQMGRNIVPILVDDYKWNLVEPKLIEGLEPLKKYNCAELITRHHRLFNTSVDVLCDDFLSKAATRPSIEPTPESEELAEDIIEASKSETVNENALKAERLIAQGTIAFGLNNYKVAIKKFTEASKIEPDWYLPYFVRGSLKDDLGQYADAIADYTHAIVLNPNSANAYSDRGHSFAKLGEHEKAIADYTRAIELNHNLAVAYNNRGYSQRILGEYSKSLNDYNRAIKLNTSFILALNNRGNLHSQMGNHDKAIQDYSQAIELDEYDNMAYYNRGTTYLELDRYEEAIDDLNHAILLNSQDADTYFVRGSARLSLGRHTEALADYNKGLKLNPLNSYAYINRGAIYLEIGQINRGIRDIEKALKIDPANESARIALEHANQIRHQNKSGKSSDKDA